MKRPRRLHVGDVAVSCDLSLGTVQTEDRRGGEIAVRVTGDVDRVEKRLPGTAWTVTT